ncbi:ferrous iron transport protein A [Clostridium tetanomorphum]|uniref:Ferrous iron transport protein A n=1 Tax=Clostridium tetanomorphum TaxID=1553 RepID=A0A923J0M8_CLOTT|nr:ferrous iron transport protein A [Clostridium tetanomorphum]KAJ53520.1 FeoA family protein [Clostridium tetanomorphum DSM 665]MBC2396895.1 ferrous iron transport protein A [Clostridium tetanomorphum]MBP1863142.1 ferrous iron transport protein A [Clostridium tetanomorphum]NRS84250.1 ferrous iron transport protein A [Clostridium tetanomorphum]NRZ97464.1 ferrous iron transport protein A [Clostridium tetanomorphum]
MSIFDLKPGQTALVKDIYGNEKLAKRLLALGCIKGTEVCVKKVAPFGDPIIINLRGFDLAIRKNDAKNISIESKERLEAIYDNCCTAR